MIKIHLISGSKAMTEIVYVQDDKTEAK